MWRKLFKEFPESVKYSCYNRKIWTSKNKPSNSKVAGSLCLNYAHSCICFWVSCKSMKSKSWSLRMVTRTHARTHAHTRTHTHEDIFAVNTTRLLLCVWPFSDTVHWKVERIMAGYTSLVHCGTFFHPKNISWVYVFRSKTSTGVQK